MILPIKHSLALLSSCLIALCLSHCEINGNPEPSSVSTDSPGIPDNENSHVPELDDPLFLTRDVCVTKINDLRRTEGLNPLGRWQKGEKCADSHAKIDFETSTPHYGFDNENCGARAQNECPKWDFNNLDKSVESCLERMWSEKDGPANQQDHYRNMTNGNYSEVACGFFISGNKVTMVQNFR